MPDGKFTYTFEDPRHLFEMTGSWTDDTANRTIIVTVETVPAAQSNWIGYPLLFAYAPNGAPDRINVSLSSSRCGTPISNSGRHQTTEPLTAVTGW